ncbi:hypothetical protein F9C07_2251722 [Aspergillus flavus]|uniref:Arrestin-like N-terminal domain-containing protein n=1 Tax=Aspergillus flavus (strain ATCC 200026 / FGSC A1120 / IAM 13836 / NRRL 3357 / JCM 12722 / SRRC 167) TaxID=332952 RepID=A0A7G5JU65_ASPFN|nr:uncharacterized protein G4B84_002382 [Aspergillus flavus NRRL3357]KAJ1705623.1 hypothetical protein NYO67_12221 [Aspergillus flavus]KAF7631531.1 hypothetical protein AFLA_012387 [Aspergillus flavus NRRL3357]QMW27093.1 hypothetical protein G4B84_002382 [Aspergillus flavus NRRL3357]QMW39157.1 hypothetical protein G4B11_002437 [Aspergillus flavus]QRD81440.1 hypothetical protein F9C07_2251722 [Aspergillus flavus]
MSPTCRSRPLLNRRPAPKISIKFDNSRQRYTTGEQIEGEVKVTVDAETKFSEINISLEGSSRVTLLQPITTQLETSTSHTFLTLDQPIDDVNYPASRILRPGKVYNFPYTFIVPNRFPLKPCSHEATHTSIRQAHTEAPPSLLLRNLSQSLCEISYLIRVVVCQQHPNNGKLETLASCTKPLHLVPVHGGGLSSSRSEKHMYRSSIVQEVKSQWKRQALGRLEAVVSILQPIQVPSLCLPTDTVNTDVALQLRFDPVRDTLPPRLAKIHPTLKQSTLFSTKPQDDYPSIDNIIADQMSRGAHVQVSSLPSHTISSIRWTKHMLPQYSGSSGFDQSSQPSSTTQTGLSLTPSSGCYYTASVMVPVSLPSNSDLAPTFHSCLVSRAYALELRLSYCMPNASVFQRMSTLEVPVKIIGVSTLDTSGDNLPSYSSSTPEKPSHFVSLPTPYYIERKSWNTEYSENTLRGIKCLQAPEWHEACTLPTYDDVVTRSAKLP